MPQDRWALAAYALRRCAQAVILILGLIVFTFLLIRLAPGGPVSALVGNFPAPDSYVREVREEYGLNEPLWRQITLYVWNLLQGDLGYSFANREPVLDLIMARAGNTAMLMLSAMALAVAVGIPLGTVAARRPGSFLDSTVSTVGLAGYGMPVFWLGQLLILGLALRWSVFPPGGMTSLRAPVGGLGYMTTVAVHLALPAFTLSFRYMALYLRVTRASMLDALRADFVLTARAKGLSRLTVSTKHALRNALLPVVTVVGYELGFALSGSVLVETVFSWPGIGRLLYTSITNRDTPVVLGIFLVFSVTVVIVNLLTDLLYAKLDPRVRLGAVGHAT